jgi:hypothetical protein
MRVGIARITLRLAYPYSLKDKRRLLKGLIAQLKRDFNVSVAEVAEQDNRRSAVLGVAVVSNDGGLSQRVLHKLVAHIEKHPDVSVEQVESEVL